jgi:uncharacterized RDD family membrane protein YckC
MIDKSSKNLSYGGKKVQFTQKYNNGVGWFVLILLFPLTCIFGTKTSDKKPAGSSGFFNAMIPPQINNINTCYYQSQIWLFYEKSPFFNYAYPDSEISYDTWPGAAYYRIFDGVKWSDENELGWRIHYALADSNMLLVLLKGGYKTYENGRWSKINEIEGYSCGFACSSPQGIYIFYDRNKVLFYRILKNQKLSQEHVAQEPWENRIWLPSRFNPDYPRAVYAHNKIWLFYGRPREGNLKLFYKSYNNNQWSDEEYLTDGMQYWPVVINDSIFVFYLNWLHDMSNMPATFRSMQRINYRFYDGQSWSDVHYLNTGQTSLVNSLVAEDDIWVFVVANSYLSYVRRTDGKWNKVKSISKQSSVVTASLLSFSSYFIIFFIIPSLVVFFISHLIEKKKRSIIQFGEKRYACASLLRRYLAHVVDYLLFLLLFGIFFLISFLSKGVSWFSSFWGIWLIGFFGFFMIELVYFVVLEGHYGKTLGKWFLKIKVVSTAGQTCGIKKALIRNIMRIADGFFYYIVGVVLLVTMDNHQRLGDYLAKTYVILDKQII